MGHGVFIAFVLSSMVAIGADAAEITLMDRVVTGDPVTDAAIEANDSRQMTVGVLVLALWLRQRSFPSAGSTPRIGTCGPSV